MDSVQNLERTISNVNKKIRKKQMNEKIRKVGLKFSKEIQILQKKVDKNLIN